MRKKLPRQFTKEQGCKFIQFTPNSENVKQAFERSQKLGVLSNSFTYGAGRMTGFLGEIAFELLYTKSKYVGGRILSHDYVLGRKKIDVKAKTCGGKPLPHYIASVNCSKTRPPKADYYYFVRVKKDLSCAWLLGWISQEKLIELGEYKRRGAEDESGFKYKVSGYHLPISDLKTPLSLR
tara:strand:- start:1400 stop:1939 length:540 start_codon:yes stop_codon:yes gene_type:complete